MQLRLQAEEKLVAINVAALAAGAGEPTERQRIFAELERKAAGIPAPKPQKADAGDLSAMGISLRAGGDEMPVITDRDAWLGNSGGQADG